MQRSGNLIRQIDYNLIGMKNNDPRYNRTVRIRGKLLHSKKLNKIDIEFLKQNNYYLGN